MEAKELRLNNLVFFGINDKLQIHSIIPKDIRLMDKGEQLFKTESEWYQPIPLTEEILLKCGFEKCNLLFINDIIPFVKIVKCGDYFDVIIGNVFYVKLYSLHQLQNLYFTLTGQELEINL